MAAPLSRFGQITQAETLINTNTNQDISAADVRNTLTGIIDSTTGMKLIYKGRINVTTVWSATQGTVNSQVAWRINSGTVSYIMVQEHYSDPYFFPVVQGSNVKYQIYNAGSGIVGSATQNNVATSLLLPTAGLRFGGGLTLNCQINTTSLTLGSVAVANPGSGYFSQIGGATALPDYGEVEINLSATTKPKVRINNGVSVTRKTSESNSASLNNTNFGNVASLPVTFCFNTPNIDQALYQPSDIAGRPLDAIFINYRFAGGTSLDPAGSGNAGGINQGSVFSTSTNSYINSNNVPGFDFGPWDVKVNGQTAYNTPTVVFAFDIEIKVPIINTTF